MVETEFRDDSFNYFFDVMGFKVLYLHKVKVSSGWEIKVLSSNGLKSIRTLYCGFCEFIGLFRYAIVGVVF